MCLCVFVFALQMLTLFPNLDVSHSLGCTPGFLLVYKVGGRGALYLMEVILPCIWTALLIFQALPRCDLEAALWTGQSVPGLRSAVGGGGIGPRENPCGGHWQGPVSIRVDTAADLGVSVPLRQAEGFQS